MPFHTLSHAMPALCPTVGELAELLGPAEKSTYRLAHKGELTAFKVRGRSRFKRADLDEWIEQQKAASRDNDGESDG